MSNRLLEATRQYQIFLEAHRHDPDDEATWEELCAARQNMEREHEIYCLNKTFTDSGPTDQTAS